MADNNTISLIYTTLCLLTPPPPTHIIIHITVFAPPPSIIIARENKHCPHVRGRISPLGPANYRELQQGLLCLPRGSAHRWCPDV